MTESTEDPDDCPQIREISGGRSEILVLDRDQRGPSDPIALTPPRLEGSVRYTTSIDTTRPDGFDGDLVIDARARVLITNADGPTVKDETQVRARVHGSSREVLEIWTDRDEPPLGSLVGSRVGPGFRARLGEFFAETGDTESAVHMVLDDFPGAVLVSGYAMLQAGVDMGPAEPRAFESLEDLCAGWAADGVMIGAIRTHGRMPTPVGPPSPSLERLDDPAAWHSMVELGPNAMRRRRRLDLLKLGASRYSIDAMFRDSCADGNGFETSLHEYSVSATVTGQEHVITEIAATPHVLPWVECPSAAASAGRLLGIPLSDLRKHVREHLTGLSTCTHLNDVLRGLANVGALIAHIPEDV